MFKYLQKGEGGRWKFPHCRNLSSIYRRTIFRVLSDHNALTKQRLRKTRVAFAKIKSQKQRQRSITKRVYWKKTSQKKTNARKDHPICSKNYQIPSSLVSRNVVLCVLGTNPNNFPFLNKLTMNLTLKVYGLPSPVQTPKVMPAPTIKHIINPLVIFNLNH